MMHPRILYNKLGPISPTLHSSTPSFSMHLLGTCFGLGMVHGAEQNYKKRSLTELTV